MKKTRIALACQGGGSQTAFTAGALKALCESGIGEEIEIVSISGTSGGAVCAALVWYTFKKGERPRWTRLIDFWKENTAQTLPEQMFNHAVVESVRMINTGLLPTWQLSPASPMLQAMVGLATFGHRPGFSDFPALLNSYIDFDEVAGWGASFQPPILMLGAANVLTGRLAKFVSSLEPIRIEHILASCAVPNIFPAVRIGADAYWDGLFSDNPPVKELIHPRSVGPGNVPEEIWLIKINPTARSIVPEQAVDILDRRNQMEGNISLFQQLSYLEMLNDMILRDAFRPEFLAEFDIKAPIRIPRSASADIDRPYHIPCIEMSAELQKTISYEGKIDRSARNIDFLIAEGEAAARIFLQKRAALG